MKWGTKATLCKFFLALPLRVLTFKKNRMNISLSPLGFLEAVLKMGSEGDSHFLAVMIQALDVDRPEPGPDGQDRPQDQALSFGFDR
jgi:hypothetical protein